MDGAERPILITGAGGKLGSVLRAVWPRRLAGRAVPVWQSRAAGFPGAVVWQPGEADYAGPPLAGGVVLHLAGGRIGVAETVALTRAVLDLGRAQDVLHVFLASSGAVYGTGGDALTEAAPLRPQAEYGAAKAAMEAEALSWRRGSMGVTCLRIGNVLGCDALIGRAVMGIPVVLDPVAGQPGGPVRSYIGPVAMAEALARLCLRALDGGDLPATLNVAAGPPVAMGDLLDAAGLDWRYGPANPAVLGRVVLDVARLGALVGPDVAAATPASMLAEWRALRGDVA